MKIYSRASWGARYRNGVATRRVGSLEKYLHHSVTKHLSANATLEQDKVQIRVVERIGQERFGAGMSYTFLIPPSGRIFEGASVHRVSYHSGGGRDGRPRNTLGAGICLVGNTEANEMTPQQVVAVVWLLQHGVRMGWWQDPAITEGHRDFKATSCPGRHAYKLISEINRRGRGGRASGVSPTPAPAPSGPSARPDVEVQLALAALGYYDAGPDLQYLDGINGDHQKAAVRDYQRARGLHVDDWWGTNTDKHFEEHDMSKIVDQIATASAAKTLGWRTDHIGLDAWGVARNTYHGVRELQASVRGLVGAVTAMAQGETFDEAKLLAGVQEAAREGARVEAGELAEHLAPALAEALNLDPDTIRDAVRGVYADAFADDPKED